MVLKMNEGPMGKATGPRGARNSAGLVEPLPLWFKSSVLFIVWCISMFYSARKAVLAVHQLSLYPSPEYEDWTVLAVSALIFGLPWIVISVVAVFTLIRVKRSPKPEP